MEEREWKYSKADGGLLFIFQGQWWQSNSPSPKCNQRVDSWDNDIVAADQLNHCSQRPWNSNDINDSSNDTDNADDANNARQCTDDKAKAKSDI
jgi:hypothetical protein